MVTERVEVSALEMAPLGQPGGTWTDLLGHLFQSSYTVQLGLCPSSSGAGHSSPL